MPTEASDLGAWSRLWGIDLNHPEAAAFVDYHQARGTTFKDWSAGWRTWQRNAKKFVARDIKGKPIPEALKPLPPLSEEEIQARLKRAELNGKTQGIHFTQTPKLTMIVGKSGAT